MLQRTVLLSHVARTSDNGPIGIRTVDLAPAGRHGASVSSSLALLRFVHFFGFILAIGGAAAAQRAIRLAREHSAASRAGIEVVARKLVTSMELVGLFVALGGGIGLIAQNPHHLQPAQSGAGPWLHVKLALVLAALVLSHLKMFRLARLVREREAGASEAECDALLMRAKALGGIGLALLGAILALTLFRYAWFA